MILKKRLVIAIFFILLVLSIYSFIYVNDKFGKPKLSVSSIDDLDHINTWYFTAGVTDGINDSEADWLSKRFKVAIGNTGDQNIWLANNPNVKLCGARPLEYLWDTDHDKIKNWGIANGRDYEKVYLHFKEDSWIGDVGYQGKGWNPNDDLGQCGGVAGDWINDLINNIAGNCSGLPSDPKRTAATGEEARVRFYSNQPLWRIPDVRSQEWLDWGTYNVLNCGEWAPNSTCQIDCVWQDNLIYLPLGQFGLNQTFKYWGVTEDYTTPYIEDRFIGGSDLRDSISAALGRSIFAVPNVGSTPGLTSIQPFRQFLIDYYDNVMIEIWMDSQSSNGPDYKGDYKKELLQILNDTLGTNEKRFIQTEVLITNNTNIRKMFLLSSFYLINNPNLYYLYQIEVGFGYTLDDKKIDHPSTWIWFDAIEYDVGSPIVNSFGKLDYKGDTSKEHFEFANGTDPSDVSKEYHVLGREYENALILVKMRPESTSLLGSVTKTTHNLGGNYMQLSSDGTLGSVVNSITLENNEGVILVKESISPPSPSGGGGGNVCTKEFVVEALLESIILQGATKEVEVSVNNTGTCTLNDLDITLEVPEGWTSTNKIIDEILPGEYKIVNIDLISPKDATVQVEKIRVNVAGISIFGVYDLFVEVKADVEEQPTTNVEITDKEAANMLPFIMLSSTLFIVFIIINIFWIHRIRKKQSKKILKRSHK